MSIKYNNSMYTTNPPETFIETDIATEYCNKFVDEIEEHVYEIKSLLDFDKIEREQLFELIKNESKRII